MQEIFEINKINQGFPHLFLNTYPVAEPWLFTILIFLTFIYVVKRTSITKGLWATLPLFIFSPIILIYIYGIENVYQEVSVLLIFYILAWVVVTKIFKKTPIQ